MGTLLLSLSIGLLISALIFEARQAMAGTFLVGGAFANDRAGRRDLPDALSWGNIDGLS